jgi:hypothetical protein
MTKYHNDNEKNRLIKDDTPISIAEETISYDYDYNKREYFCKHCSRKLFRLTDSSGKNQSYYCNFCSIEFDLGAELRSKSKLTVPDGVNREAFVSTKFPEYTVGKEPVEYKGAFKALQQKGIKITNYKETDKAGRYRRRTISS